MTAAVIAAEHARRAALLRSDVSALESLLADDHSHIHSNGKLENKREVVEAFATKRTAFERFELDQLRVTPITADVAVVNGAIDQRKLSGGKWSDVKLRFQAVWRNEVGRWRLVSLQTVMPPAPHD